MCENKAKVLFSSVTYKYSYKCTCGYYYVINNCGKAMEKGKCPKCGKDIGGEDH